MFDSILGQSLTLPTFLICTGVSLVLGVVLALASSFRARTSQSFGLTLQFCPRWCRSSSCWSTVT